MTMGGSSIVGCLFSFSLCLLMYYALHISLLLLSDYLLTYLLTHNVSFVSFVRSFVRSLARSLVRSFVRVGERKSDQGHLRTSGRGIGEGEVLVSALPATLQNRPISSARVD